MAEENTAPMQGEPQSGDSDKMVEKLFEDLRKIAKGTMKLAAPIRAGGKDVKELKFDFTALSGRDYVEAMDSDRSGSALFRMTSAQALALFAATAGRCTDGIDATDIRERIGITDCAQAVQLAQLFILASNRAASGLITNES